MKHLDTLRGISNSTSKDICIKWSVHNPKSTCIGINTRFVYNIIEGYSLKILYANNHYIIEMKICDDLVIRYLNLSELYIPSRSAIPSGFKMGKADKFVGIEYCTKTKSNYPVRIGDSTYYKHDPTMFLLNDYLPEISLKTYYLVVSRHFESFNESSII